VKGTGDSVIFSLFRAGHQSNFSNEPILIERTRSLPGVIRIAKKVIDSIGSQIAGQYLIENRQIGRSLLILGLAWRCRNRNYVLTINTIGTEPVLNLLADLCVTNDSGCHIFMTKFFPVQNRQEILAAMRIWRMANIM